MSVFAWCSRRAAALSIGILLTLCYYVISLESLARQSGYQHEASGTSGSNAATQATSYGAGIWTFVFAYYSLLVHVLVNFFPIRACWTIWELTQTVRRSSRTPALPDFNNKASLPRRGSYASMSSAETFNSETVACSSTTSEAGDVELETYTDGGEKIQDAVIHAIVIPNYKEEMESLRETLDVLASHPQAQTAYDIYLGMEQREAEGETKALTLLQQYVKKFRSIDFTSHPADIPGEAAGKGSNMAWAARKLSAKYSMAMRKNVIVTGIDADSHLSANYFTSLTGMHLSFPETATTTLYSAPVIFDRNAHQVSAIVRVADILWCACGMSGLYRGSSIAPPTSVYSLSLELIDRVGGWDSDGEAIGEDLHMYIKCFFALNGNLTSRVIPCPVSQSNVTGASSGGIRGTLSDVSARYKQAIRHMWGSLDTGFALRCAVDMWQERKQTSRTVRPLHLTHGHNSELYCTSSQVVGSASQYPRQSGIFSDVTHETMEEPHLENIFYLFHRLFEAHFMPVHMAVLIFASTAYVWVTDGTEDPHNLAWTFKASEVFRTTGFLLIGVYLFLYESYHRVCVNAREREMTQAGMAEGMGFSHRSLKKNLIDYSLVPICAPLYELVYTVSKKAVRQRAKSFTANDMA